MYQDIILYSPCFLYAVFNLHYVCFNNWWVDWISFSAIFYSTYL